MNEARRYKEFSLLYKLTYNRIIMSKCISNTIIITGTIHIYTYNVDGLPHDYKTIYNKNYTY